MEGSRKQKAFYVAQVMMFIMGGGALLLAPANEVSGIFQWFSISTMALAGGFFSFNVVGDHLAKAWPKAMEAKWAKKVGVAE